jgi:Xaa-Pro aminopeptidase
MPSLESLRKHLCVLESLSESEKSDVFERLANVPKNVRESELRALLLKEEKFLVGKKRVRLVSGIPRIPHGATLVADISEAGKYLTELLHVLRDAAIEGVSLLEIDFLTRAFARKYGLELPMLGYGGFANSVTVGVNDRVVHAVPDESLFRNGDLVTIDAAVRYRTGIADSAVAFVVGGEKANPFAQAIV